MFAGILEGATDVDILYGKEIDLATNQKASRELEFFIRQYVVMNPGKGDVVIELCRGMLKRMIGCMMDQYGSHVFQTLMSLVPLGGEGDLLQGLVGDMSEAIRSSGIVDLACHRTASHVLRSFILLLYGEHPSFDELRTASRKRGRAPPSPSCISSTCAQHLKPTLDLFIAHIEKTFSNMTDLELMNLACDQYFTKFFEVVLRRMHRTSDDRLASIRRRLLSKRHLKDLIDDYVGCGLVHVLVQTCANLEEFERIFTRVVKRLKKDEQNENNENSSSENFVLDRLVGSLVESTEMLPGHLMQIIEVLPKCNAWWKVCSACLRMDLGYKNASKRVLSFGTSDVPTDVPKEESENGGDIWKSLLELGGASAQNINPSPSGVSLVECLIRFPEKTIGPLVHAHKKLFAYAPILAKHPQGSYLIQQLITGEHAFSSMSQKLIRSLLGCIVDLGMHPRGSYVVAAAYESANVSLKKEMGVLMLERLGDLRKANLPIIRKLNLEDLKSNESGWTKKVAKRQATSDAFDELLVKHKKHKTLKGA